MYLLFVDESGTHGGVHPFVLGAMAIHEDDAAIMQKALDALVVKHLGRVPLNLEEYELHASELRNAKKPQAGKPGKTSIWANVDRGVRAALLEEAYELIVSFQPVNPALPIVLFSVVVEKKFRSNWAELERERFAYEVLLGKFDVMLKNVSRTLPNRGLVIHDRRVVAEHDIQTWTTAWRATAERIGQLKMLADVPLFADSRATRLLQVADLVSYAVFRRYNPPGADRSAFDILWPAFHTDSGVTHGCVHFTPDFGQGECDCSPCEQRLRAEAHKAARPRRREAEVVATKPPRNRKRTRATNSDGEQS